MSAKISIKELSPDDRPREKLLLKGVSVLSDAEILGILIGSGSSDQTAVQLCQTILKDNSANLNKLAKMTVHDLMKYKGIGEAKAISIIAALELGRRRKPENFNDQKAIKSAADVYQIMKGIFKDKEHEEFYSIALSRANKVKSIDVISIGGVSGTVADGKIIFKKALEKSASAIILCHNHPSGNLQPSKADINLTQKLKEFGHFIDLPVLDHLIITNEAYYSFADEGIL